MPKPHSSSRRKTTRVVRTISGKLPPPVSKSGIPITDELADQLADEAERGYELRRRAGRRSLAGGSGHSPRLSFRTTPELYERAAARAASEGKTVSQLAREALKRLVGGE